MSTSIRFATYPDVARRFPESKIVTIRRGKYHVSFVTPSEEHDIRFQKFTKDYSGYNSRPYVTSFSSFKTLQAAVSAVVRHRAKS